MGMVNPTLPDAPETLAAELGMPVSTPLNAFEISAPSFQALIEDLPDLHLILEHYGFLHLREDQQEKA
jgi:hypothetical protein